jgi:RNA polymerase sigma factor (sigma-70 family)
MDTRQTLLTRLRDQYDEQSWEDFVRFYRPFIYSIVRKMNLDHHDADEIVQQIALKSWKCLPDFKYTSDKGSFRSWLSRMTRNCVLDYIKSRNRYNVRIDKLATDYEVLSEPEVLEIAQEEWETYITGLAWKNIENSFSENVKKCFELFMLGRTPEEVGLELGIKVSSVYVYKKRVKERLIEEIRQLKFDLE